MQLKSGQKQLVLNQPLIMGILNVTPDSFSDGGRFTKIETACHHIDSMVAQGASFIDIGGESTRPGAKAVSLQQQLDRVIPLIEYTGAHHQVWISIDTSNAKVMAAAVEAGAHMINDIRALQEPDALTTAAKLGVPVCLMHMQGQPRTMQQSPSYTDVVDDIATFFEARIAACVGAGFTKEQLILDPGFGFGKLLCHNYELLNRLAQFKRFNLPILIGLSRKSMVGSLLSAAVDDRLAGSLSGAMIGIQRGANIVRVHDVKETMAMIKVMQAVTNYNLL